jgi:hypothetical protein
MLHFLPDGEHRYRLIDGDGREVGWIRGRALRFFGVRSEQELMTAASKAWRALQSVLTCAVGRATDGALPRQLRLVHDGAYEWIADGMIPIARVFRSKSMIDASPAIDSPLAIELVMPSYADEQVAKSAALAIASALGHPRLATNS